MSTGLLVPLIFLLVCVGGLGLQASKVWKGDEKAVGTIVTGFSTFPFASNTKRGMARGIVPLTAQLFFLMVAVISAVVGMSGGHRGQLTPGLAVALVAFAGALVSFGLHLAVIWFNRPSFLVPPSMRADLGIFQRPRFDEPA